MVKKILFFFFFININNYCFAEQKFEIIAVVNNISITRLDLSKEIKIIEILNNKINLTNQENIALKNIIDEKIKTIEIEKEKMKIDENSINNSYKILLNNLNLESSNLDESIENLIKEKIKIDRLWNELIKKKFSWKVNINIDELNKKILQEKTNVAKIEKIKEKIILEEKNKKILVYSNFYLNELRSKTLIKYLK